LALAVVQSAAFASEAAPKDFTSYGIDSASVKVRTFKATDESVAADPLGRNASVAITMLDNGNLLLKLTNLTPADNVKGHDWALTGFSFIGFDIGNCIMVDQWANTIGNLDKADKKTIDIASNYGDDVRPMFWQITHNHNQPNSMNFIDADYGMAIISEAVPGTKSVDHLWYPNGQQGSVTTLNPYAYGEAYFELQYNPTLEGGFDWGNAEFWQNLEVVFYFENGINPILKGKWAHTPEPTSLALLGLGAAGLLAKRRRSR